MKENTQWLSCYKPNPRARLRMFCFPYAGGGASIFRTWSESLPNWTEICPVQFPGRENRIREKSFETMKELIPATAKALMPYFDLPMVFFGHSMGAWIAYELAYYLKENNNLMPQHLFIGGRFAPHLPEPNNFHLLPEKQFREQLKNYNGTPSAVLENDEFMQLLMPLLKADFSICETYIYKQREPLNCPISVFSGKDDYRIEESGLYAWQQHTSSKFRVEIFEGEHFFLRSAQKELLKSITSDLENEK